jgi:D,D-heptose 1,7-bisphosphate phosphatase
MEGMNKAVFLDRDGVINEIIYHHDIGVIDSPFTPGQFHLRDGVAQAIREINGSGFLAIIATNQPGIAKGHFDEHVLNSITEKMINDLAIEGAHLDDIYTCLHHPKGNGNGSGDTRYIMDCNCRKPKPGLILEAARKHRVNLNASYMIGDSITDIQAGVCAGCTTFLIGQLKCDLCKIMEKSGVKPNFIVSTLLEAVKIIKDRENWKISYADLSGGISLGGLPLEREHCVSDNRSDDKEYLTERFLPGKE